MKIVKGVYNMKVIKVQGKQTYKNKQGVEKHYYNYYLVCDNGKSIQIKCQFDTDYARLDMVAEYVSK